MNKSSKAKNPSIKVRDLKTKKDAKGGAPTSAPTETVSLPYGKIHVEY